MSTYDSMEGVKCTCRCERFRLLPTHSVVWLVVMDIV